MKEIIICIIKLLMGYKLLQKNRLKELLLVALDHIMINIVILLNLLLKFKRNLLLNFNIMI